MDENHPRTTKITTSIGENDFNRAKDAVKNILKETNCDTERMNQILKEKGYNEELINAFCSYVEQRKNSFLALLLLQHNSLFGETVVTFDWLVKLVFGVSELKKIKYPLLQLAMTTTNDKQVHTHRSFDISKDMLIKLIDVLENIE